MFSGSGEERTGFRKEKKKNKKKNLIAAKSGLKGMRRYFRKYNCVKYLFAVLQPFLDKTAFHVKFSGRFSGPKAKVIRY